MKVNLHVPWKNEPDSQKGSFTGRKMKKRVTIQDIADALGISRNTVSKAINNTEGLAETTRDRILPKAVEMGYKQFSYMQTISEAQKQIADHQSAFAGEISLFSTVFLPPSHFSSLMLDKFQRELSLLGFTLNSHRVNQEDLISKSLPMTFIRERVKGIICFEMFDSAYDEMLCELGIPILFLDTPCRMGGKILPADQLYMDNTTGITKLVSNMLACGKQKIGFISNYEHCQSFFECYMAFRDTMLLNNVSVNVSVNEKWIIRENKWSKMIIPLENMKELPDLFICANDFVAYDAIQILREFGKKIPQDVMIAGFDDSTESRLITPPLTTVHIHTEIMAFSALHLLISRINEPSLDYRTIHTKTDLIYRESTPLS